MSQAGNMKGGVVKDILRDVDERSREGGIFWRVEVVIGKAKSTRKRLDDLEIFVVIVVRFFSLNL